LIAQRTNVHFSGRTMSAQPSTATYTITDLAREFDITPRAIRFYEDQGLLAPDREGPSGRKRVYNSRERTRLKLTLRGKRLGLTLNEIREILDLYESRAIPRRSSSASCICWPSIAARWSASWKTCRRSLPRSTSTSVSARRCWLPIMPRTPAQDPHCLRLPHPST
jgi:DNA-binding transcriptional MerR regulator